MTDRTTHDGEVLGAGQDRPAVDEAVAGDEPVGGDRGDDAPVDRTDQRAELDKGAGIEEGVEAGTRVEAARGAALGEPLGGAHSPGRDAAGPEVVEEWLPVGHETSASACMAGLPNTVFSSHARFR